MKKQVVKLAIIAVALITSNTWGDYSFGQWAIDAGLATNVTTVNASGQGITSLDGLTDYPNIEILELCNNPITRIKSDAFAGMQIQVMLLSSAGITTIETGAFSEMETLYRLYLNGNIPLENKLLNWRGAKFRDLNNLTIKDLDITKVDLSFSELTQSAFDIMMANFKNISAMNLANADLSNITQFNWMYLMANLQTLNFANVTYAPYISDGHYQEVVELVNALEQQGILSFLTIDDALYTARQGYFDDWDAQPLNELTIIPSVPGQICTAPIKGDMNDDCKIDFKDLADILSRWLECNLEPEDLCWQ